jgi:hypothetical protein
MIGPGGGKCFLMPWGSCFEVRWCQLQVEENEIIFHISFDISHLKAAKRHKQHKWLNEKCQMIYDQ